MKTLRNVLLAVWCSSMLAVSSVSADATQTSEVVTTKVESQAEKQVNERRDQVIKEAVQALVKTQDALTALEKGQVDEALDALAVTTGKLELVLARNPDLALAPTNVTVASHDLDATVNAVQETIAAAKDALNDGRIQEARRLLDGMYSEYIIYVSSIPLSTFPAAIKGIVPLIDDGKIDEAKLSLHAALNTIVVTQYSMPLPLLRATEVLGIAESLVRKENRSDEDNKVLHESLEAAKEQLALADILGYGDYKETKNLYDDLDTLSKQTGDRELGFIDKVKRIVTD